LIPEGQKTGTLVDFCGCPGVDLLIRDCGVQRYVVISDCLYWLPLSGLIISTCLVFPEVTVVKGLLSGFDVSVDFIFPEVEVVSNVESTDGT
jgi:hypothetical protein